MMSTRKSVVLALTLATGPLLIASTAHAAPSCGTPAVEAVFTTVHHDPESVVTGQHKVVDQPAQAAVPAVWTTESYVVTPAVPAVPEQTAQETKWTVGNSTGPDGDGWATTGRTRDHAAVTQTQYQWEKVTTTTQYEWVVKVIDQAETSTTVHHDAVYDMDLYLYELKNGDTKWKPFGWNTADGHDQGWDIVVPYVHPVVTEAWDETVTTPEKSHYDKQWTTSPTEAPADGWVRSATEPLVTTETDTVFTVDDEAAPEGYSLVGQETTVLKPAYTEYEWARTVVVTPAQPEVPAVMGERQVLVSPEVPATDEVSHMEDTIVTTPAYDTQELVTPAVPAGEACPVISTGGEEIAGPGGSGAAKTTSSASAVPTLAFTGFDPELYVAGGLVLLFVGSGLTVVARRREH
ncbi:hypothetical protein [Pedococcus sp. 2YAF34]|uniref:hypothetical protein n=1 Tax=Pedococcus sp. 2YAF34 TaxID=3233032 RepID=UPI003F99FB78